MQIITFLSFTLLVAIISYLASSKNNKNSADRYFLGGRSLTAGVIAGSILLTNLSTKQIVGLNGQSYSNGLSVMAWETLAAIAMVVTAIFLLPRYLKGGLTTISQFILNITIMLIIGKFRPIPKAFIHKYTEQVDIEPWKYAKHIGLLILLELLYVSTPTFLRKLNSKNML
jgi:uncharacterized sodium:solute symporter family permease YidK